MQYFSANICILYIVLLYIGINEAAKSKTRVNSPAIKYLNNTTKRVPLPANVAPLPRLDENFLNDGWLSTLWSKFPKIELQFLLLIGFKVKWGRKSANTMAGMDQEKMSAGSIWMKMKELGSDTLTTISDKSRNFAVFALSRFFYERRKNSKEQTKNERKKKNKRSGQIFEESSARADARTNSLPEISTEEEENQVALHENQKSNRLIRYATTTNNRFGPLDDAEVNSPDTPATIENNKKNDVSSSFPNRNLNRRQTISNSNYKVAIKR
uniref:Uncharacterized protein n=1 Tax=Ditylenchus dipsaci TaxID=166011 RepID=A0A915DG66_9BILA